MYDNTFYYPSTSLVKSFSPDVSTTPGSQCDNYDSNVGFSHLICSHNADDFGVDISYGRQNSSVVSASQAQEHVETPSDYSFIDDIYESVREEIEAEKFACSSTLAAPENAPPAIPKIILAVDQPVTIVGEDGKEYRVVLQSVEENENKRKRKSENVKVCLL
ncbi:unnamed protein product [Strongylus vulgaris]|uniref:Uncharacterized protein n=1 Tax=Strongylus vulgaris TaxID=40348 RepID=A0A3P7KPL0_STRVU|nr:unnamed protein product [Strongylus vulgaris]